MVKASEGSAVFDTRLARAGGARKKLSMHGIVETSRGRRRLAFVSGCCGLHEWRRCREEGTIAVTAAAQLLPNRGTDLGKKTSQVPGEFRYGFQLLPLDDGVTDGSAPAGAGPRFRRGRAHIAGRRACGEGA